MERADRFVGLFRARTNEASSFCRRYAGPLFVPVILSRFLSILLYSTSLSLSLFDFLRPFSVIRR